VEPAADREALGRVRHPQRWAAAPSISICPAVRSVIIGRAQFKVPHPELVLRSFVLVRWWSWIRCSPSVSGETAAESPVGLDDRPPVRRGSRSELIATAALTLDGENRYIVARGDRAGKTSLSRMLSERLQAKLVLEEVEENPSSRTSPGSASGSRFQTQMQFLFSRYSSSPLRQMDLFPRAHGGRLPVPEGPDLPGLRPVGARVALYDRLVGWLELDVMKPDAVVYLQANRTRS